MAALVHNHDPHVLKTVVEIRENIRIYRAPCQGSLLYAPLSPLFPKVLNRAVKEFNPHILHVHMPNTSAFWQLFIPSVMKIPMVIHWHSDVVQSSIDPRLEKAYRVYRPFEQKLLSRAGAVIATSRPYLETSRPLGKWHAKTRVIPLGIKDKENIGRSEAQKRWAGMRWGGEGGMMEAHPAALVVPTVLFTDKKKWRKSVLLELHTQINNYVKEQKVYK